MEKVVMFTSYFSAKNHPQFGDPHLEGITNTGRVLDNNIDYLRKWYNSILSLNLNARVFYDNLTPEFITKYTTDRISFVKVDTHPEYSYNDWRFFCYRYYLIQNPNFEIVFCTDGSDVTVVKNPAELIQTYPDKKIFLCKDTLKMAQFPYLNLHQQLGWENLMYFLLNSKEWDLINMGVIGAKLQEIQYFLDLLCFTRSKMGQPTFNADIWTGNFILRNFYEEQELLIGEPVTSVFKGYQTSRKDVYFIHK